MGGNLSAVNFGEDTATQFGLMAELGTKVPMGDRLATRLSAGVGRFFESDDFLGSWSIFATFGFSFFTQPGA